MLPLLLGKRQRAVDERLCLLLVHAADVDACQLKRSPRLVILPAGSPRSFERLLLVLLGLRLAPSPSRHPSTAVERLEAALVIIGFHNRQCLVRKLRRADELTVEGGGPSRKAP